MKILHCINDPQLGIKKPFRHLDINEYQGQLAEDTVVITFSKVTLNYPTEKIIVNGTTRIEEDNLNSVLLHNIQCESPFYAQILWDIAHQLSVEGYLYIEEPIENESLLDRKYYQDSFVFIGKIGDKIAKYQKIMPLLIEKSKGIDQWSFCIPVGGDDPTFLNRCVERIIELDIPEKEIILCGVPHSDFKYADHVQIISDESDGDQVHITRKKNLLAKSAQYENLCILHDRILLPLNFYSAARKFGDHYPITGLQSFYFVDKYNLLPRRYSDFNTITQDLTQELDVQNITKKETSLISKLFYCYQHPARSQFGHDYLTGSLYITKKSLWVNYPQNENLYWNDYEDIDYGVRSSTYGIPCRINPWTITQSMNARSVIHFYGYIATNTCRGKLTMARSILEIIPFIRRKPLFRISKEDARKKIYCFGKKYGANSETLLKVASSSMTGISRFMIIRQVINEITVKLSALDEFMNDFSKDILCESMAPNEYENIIRVMFSSASPATKKNALIGSFILNNQLHHSFSSSPFFRNSKDWFIAKTKVSFFCSIVSAVYLKYFYKGIFIPLSVKDTVKVIDETTAWKE